MKTREQKLDDIEIKLKRWLTRGMRAQTEINKLLKRQARLKKTPVPKEVVEQKIADAFAPPPSAPELPPAEDLSVPTFLKRTEADVEKMKAERLAKIDKKAMPLTGKAAQDAIRGKA